MFLFLFISAMPKAFFTVFTWEISIVEKFGDHTFWNWTIRNYRENQIIFIRRGQFNLLQKKKNGLRIFSLVIVLLHVFIRFISSGTQVELGRRNTSQSTNVVIQFITFRTIATNSPVLWLPSARCPSLAMILTIFLSEKSNSIVQHPADVAKGPSNRDWRSKRKAKWRVNGRNQTES